MKSETQGAIDNTSDYPSGGYPQGVIVPDIDVLMARQAIEDANSYLGHDVAIRRKIRPEDGIERCPDCFDEVMDQAGDPRCTTCWGTTYVGGYYETELTKAIFREVRELIELTKSGVIRVIKPDVSMGYDPRVKDWDLIARVVLTDGEVTAVKDAFYINEVRYIEMAPSYELVGQRFSVARMEISDPLNNITW